MKITNTFRRCPRATIAQTRAQSGFQIVELLVSITITTVLMAAVLDALAKTYRCATASQNQVLATNVLQSLMDDIRNSSWPTINNMAGQTISSTAGQIVLVKTSSSQTGSTLHPRPIVCDLSSGAGATYSPEGQGSVLSTWNSDNSNAATVTETFTPIGNLIRVTILVTWPSDNAGGRKRLQGTTLMSPSGIHNI